MIYQPILSDDTDIIKVVVASSDKEVRPDVIELQDIDSTSEIKVDSNVKLKPAHRPGIGLIYMAISTMFFSVMALFVKMVGGQFPSFQLVFARSVVQGVLILAVLLMMKINPFGPAQHRKLIIVRGITGFINLSCYYYSIITLPLSEAVVLSFTSPVMTALWAWVVLKEKWEKIDMFGAVLSFVGVIMIARPAFLFGGEESDGENNTQRTIAVCVAVLGAVFAGAAYVVVRKLGEGVHALVFVFYFSIICCVISPFAMFFQDFQIPSNSYETWLPLIGIGIVAAIGQALANRSLQLEKAAKASAVNYLQIVWSFIWEILFLDEKLNKWSIVGAFLITGWTLVVGFKSWKSSQRS